MEGTLKMIYLRHFTPYDIEWLQKNFLIGYSADKVLDTIDAWNTKRYKGYAFEMYAITDNAKTVGWISARQHRDLYTISLEPVILPEFRRMGYATFAMQYLIGRLREREFRFAARVRKDNTAGIALYESLDFVLRRRETDAEGHKILLYKLD